MFWLREGEILRRCNSSFELMESLMFWRIGSRVVGGQ